MKIFTTDGTNLQMGEKGWGRKTLRGGGGKWVSAGSYGGGARRRGMSAVLRCDTMPKIHRANKGTEFM